MILQQNCWELVQLGTHLLWAPTAAKAPAVPVVTPEELAREALATVKIPVPRLNMRPSQHDAGGGATPFTWVNAWTSVWTSPQSWQTLSATATLGDVWAKVTVTPTVMLFRPGDGAAALSCPGPGRAWTPSDGAQAPPSGVCAYRYRSVSDGLVAHLTIRWVPSWTGSDGSGGQLAAIVTQAVSRFGVQQIQVVNG